MNWSSCSLLEHNNVSSSSRRRWVQMPVSRWGAVAVSRAPPVVARRNKRSLQHGQSSWTSAGDKQANQISLLTSKLCPQRTSSNQHSVDLHYEWETGKNASERENEWVRGTHKNMRNSVCFCLTCHWCVREIICWKERWPWMHSVSSYGVWVVLVKRNHLVSHLERSCQPLCIGDLHPFKITAGNKSAFRIIPLQRKIILILNSDPGFFISHYVGMSGSPT